MSKRFTCKNCKREIIATGFIGTHNRNHCPFCLWSRHVDLKESGDRKASCRSLMVPIAVTFKKEGKDKYGKEKQGEIMLVHLCEKCGDLSINRIAGDDNPDQIISIYKGSFLLDEGLVARLKENKIKRLDVNDEQELKRQLFGSL